MAVKVGINGFGRIGRQVFKGIYDNYGDVFDVVAVNDITNTETLTHLLKYDSNYGQFPADIRQDGDNIVVDGKKTQVLTERDPAQLPWKDLGVEIVIESTGIFTKREKAGLHLDAGAKKVIISAPASEPDLTVVLGVNETVYNPKEHNIISNASCTTNCLAPVAKVVYENFGISQGLMTTVHAYTSDQALLDMPHKDLRRARGAAMSIIPTTTGAARALALVIPELKGKFDGFALRVPTSTVSLVDFNATIEKSATAEDINNALKEAANSSGWLGRILAVTEEPLVSIDLKANPHSSVVDLPLTMVMEGKLVKILSWYDNEWAYAVRVGDLAKMLVDKGL